MPSKSLIIKHGVSVYNWLFSHILIFASVARKWYPLQCLYKYSHKVLFGDLDIGYLAIRPYHPLIVSYFSLCFRNSHGSFIILR